MKQLSKQSHRETFVASKSSLHKKNDIGITSGGYEKAKEISPIKGGKHGEYGLSPNSKLLQKSSVKDSRPITE